MMRTFGVYLIFAAVALRGAVVTSDAPYFEPVLGLLTVYGLLLFAVTSLVRRQPFFQSRFIQFTYLFLQSALVIALLVVSEYEDLFANLFIPLSLDAVSFFDRRLGYLCITAFSLALTGTLFFTDQGRIFGLAMGGLYSGVCFLFGGYAAQVLRTEAAHDQNRRTFNELQTAHRQLQGYADQVANLAVEHERNRLARDLHDAVSQTLFSASLIADVLPKLWERDPEIGKRKLDELRVLTRGALAEMRTLLLELRPSSLIELDLADLLRHLSNAFTGRTRIPLALNVEGLADPPLEVKEAVYRVVQESLNNINKHAQASRVFIDLHRSEDHIQLDIRDDGCGFDAGNISHESLGLGIMRERAESIGAQFFIQTGIGAGTRIELIWKDGQP
ncbi:MAG: hypothetical protein C3F07_07910 [Anaerolineales bacterium]|nr:MAG: hypothetical protein C3F07_07910 [Anaerolineales bacterium]